MSAQLKIDVVIPAYNEGAYLEALVTAVREVRIDAAELKLWVIDDGSTDDTLAVARSLEAADLTVLVHERNQGKGAAIHTGLQRCQGDVFIIQDADLEYDPHDYALLVDRLRRGDARVVYGNRFADGRPPNMTWTFWYGNRLLTWVANRLCGQRLHDVETCYKAFAGDVARQLHIRTRGFAVEGELTARVSNLGIVIDEVAVRYQPRSRAAGKKITWVDGIRTLLALAYFRLRRS